MCVLAEAFARGALGVSNHPLLGEGQICRVYCISGTGWRRGYAPRLPA
jgi:hypothetical protein